MDSEGIEISLPVDFLQKALKSGSSDKIRTCLFNTHICDIKTRIQTMDIKEDVLCLFVCKTGKKVEWSNALKIHISDVCLDGDELNGEQECQSNLGMLKSAVDEPNLSFTENQGVKVPKRKRGRPKKSRAASGETKQKILTFETDRKRYSLRGVQISKSIMNAEKGIEGESKDGEYESEDRECESAGGDEISSVSKECEDATNASDYCGVSGKIIDDLEIFEGEGKVTEDGHSKLTIEESNQELENCQQMDTNQSNSVLQEFSAECYSKLSKKMVNKLNDNKYVEDKHGESTNLKQNPDQYSDSKTSTCQHCGKSYKNFQTLRNHIRYVHKTTGQQNQCKLCPAKFKHSSVLKQHLDEIHNNKVNYTCTVCKKDFTRKNQFNRHMLSHGVDKSKHLKCPQCDKGFWFKYNLTRHMELVHKPTTENFHCSYCGKGFNLKAAMVSHVQQVHFNIFPFPCNVEGCKMLFSRQKQLLDHMRQTHADVTFTPPKRSRGRYKYGRSDEDLFFCSHCRVSFCYKAKLVEHMHFAHNDSFPYVCDHCSQGFVEKSFLLHHLKYAHKQDIDDMAIQEASKESAEEFELAESEENDANCKIIMVDEEGKVLQICQPITKDTTATLKIPGKLTESSDMVTLSYSMTSENQEGTIECVIQPDQTAVIPQEIADMLVSSGQTVIAHQISNKSESDDITIQTENNDITIQTENNDITVSDDSTNFVVLSSQLDQVNEICESNVTISSETQVAASSSLETDPTLDSTDSNHIETVQYHTMSEFL